MRRAILIAVLVLIVRDASGVTAVLFVPETCAIGASESVPGVVAPCFADDAVSRAAGPDVQYGGTHVLRYATMPSRQHIQSADVVLVTVAVAVLLMLMMELWLPHGRWWRCNRSKESLCVYGRLWLSR